jgi:hypothetical protein
MSEAWRTLGGGSEAVRAPAIKGAAGFIRVGSGKYMKTEGSEAVWLNAAEVQPKRKSAGLRPDRGR